MNKIVLLYISIHLYGASFGQRQLTDTLDYYVLTHLTKPGSWVHRFKVNPTSGLDRETFDYIKEKYPSVDIEYSDIQSYEFKREIWEADRVEGRVLKPNRVRIPLIGSPPRRRPVSYISCPLFLNKAKTIALFNWSEWADLNWHFGSGFGELLIFVFKNGKWTRMKEPISGFAT